MKLQDIAILRNGKFIPENQRAGKYPIFGSTGIIGATDNILINDDAVVIGRVGANCGTIQYAKGPSWITDNCIICTSFNCDLYYIFYLLQSKKLNDYHAGSAQPLLTSKVINSIDIPKHSSTEQRHIVDILGSIDAKIENNEKIISNVLKLYRLKFRNLAMKYEQKTVLSYIASVESGKRPLHKSAALDGSFNIPIIGASSIMGYTDDYLFNEPILVIGRVGTLGVVQSIFGKSYPSDNALIIRSKYYTFCYCALNELDYNSLNKGSTQPLIAQTDIKNIQIPLIPQSEMQQFEMHNKIDIIVALKEENNMLRELKALYLKKFFE
mgnify:CR=1 FL=1